MRLVILAAGKGSRMRSAHHKGLSRYRGDRLIAHSIVQASKQISITKLLFIVGHRKEEIISYVNERFSSFPCQIIEQTKLTGIPRALKTASSDIEEACLVGLSDEYVGVCDYKGFIKNTDSFICLGVVRAHDIDMVKQNYTVKVKGNSVVHAVEKPLTPYNHLIGTGQLFVSSSFWSWIRHMKNAQVDSLNIATLVNLAISQNKKVTFFEFAKKYRNANCPDDLLDSP